MIQSNNKRKPSSPIENPTNSQKQQTKKMGITLEDIWERLNMMDKRLDKLDTIEQTVTEINCRQNTVEKKVEENSANIEFIQTDVEILQADVNRLNYDKIRNNIIIHGIPVNKDENTSNLVVTICNTLLDKQLDPQCILTRRMPINTSAPPLVIQFRDPSTKFTILKNWKELQSKSQANPSELNIQKKLYNLLNITDTRHTISITEEQTHYSHKLFNETKKLLGTKFKFIWIKYGTVYIRKAENTNIHKIQTNHQLRQFIDFQEEGTETNSMNQSSY